MLERVRVFIKVADLGSFSKAAGLLNVAPSSITRSIDKLESELSVRLFKRSTRGLHLTEEGAQFYERALPLLHDAQALFESMGSVNSEPSGTLRISAFESFGRVFISPLLPEYLSQHRELKLEMELDNHLVDMNTSNIDVGIRIGRPLDSALHARLLLKNAPILCASPAYLAAFGTPTKPEDLVDHNCLLLNNGRQLSYWYFRNKGVNKKIPVKGNLSSKGGSALLEAAVRDGGILLLSRWMLTDLMASGALVEVLPHWQPSLYEETSGDIYAVYQHLKPSIRSFIDFMVKKIKMADL